ncbi:MAG: hypothetical protein ACREAZ_08550 [Nitrososphaera sp.]
MASDKYYSQCPSSYLAGVRRTGMITIQGDLDSVSTILRDTFKLEPFKRDYDHAFGMIARILARYGVIENPRNLRFRFILCMQEFFDGIPQDKWRIKDSVFVTQSEDHAIGRFREWVREQIT